ncbi:GNAT family N-acetyltransferase [Atopobiaceae bacterium HCP3S3_F7]
MQLREVSFDQLESEAKGLGCELPIEQTEVWARYQDTVPGRSQWGSFVVEEDGAAVAFVSFLDFETHGYHYLRSGHGPVWVAEPTPEQESAALAAIAECVRARDSKVVFVRLAVRAELPETHAVLSTIPYDQTVVIDLTGSEEDVLSRFKTRGRRDVRKALRESPASYADETERARESFSEYYDVIVETGRRDGFEPAPASDYEDMLRILGPSHCRLYAGRVDGKVVTWSIVTINGTRATRYYGASRTEFQRAHVTDGLVFWECRDLAGEKGCTAYDMMGIGSDFAPSLMGLNEFKCKFSKEVTPVAPDRDLPIKQALYALLTQAHGFVAARRERKAAEAERALRERPREDLVPVIVGGDIGAYSLGAEMHAAYHCKSVCLASAPIAAIQHSDIFDVRPIAKVTSDEIVRAVTQIAQENPDKKVFLTGNTDGVIYAINGAKDRLPANVFYAVPSEEVVELVSDKARFQALCEEVGIDVPRTEYVDLAGDAPVAPCGLAFPVVAKPAVSARYDHLYAQGFKKVYFLHEQSELDALWADLRAAGFHGEFLVQELIEGDDTNIDCLTVYVASDGTLAMYGSAQVLLEDHAPTMLGNPVAMISRPMPDSWKKIEALLKHLEEKGYPYRGFCNFDTKRDPRTGRVVFMDMNPRIGRGSYYNVAGGINPMRCCVEDVIDHKKPRAVKIFEKGLFTVVPVVLVERYVSGDLLEEVRELASSGKVFDPQRYLGDRNPGHRLAVELTERNQIRKFQTFYPEPTETSF